MNAAAIDSLNIKRLVTDSRQVARGDTFVAYPGETQDGRRYIGQAIARGASSVLWEKRNFKWHHDWQVPNAGVSQLRAHAGIIASDVYADPSARLRMIGVTGTNGKTTCSQWIAHALNQCGVRTAVIGTLGYGMRAPLKPLVNTTPDAVWLQSQLASFLRRGARAVSMEVSSIGLDQDRVAGVQFDTALFTNLTRDHLDYHRTMHRYRRAKSRLFECDSLKRAIVNLDDAFGAELAHTVRRRGLSVIGYGFGNRSLNGRRLSRVSASNFKAGAAGMQFDVHTSWGDATVESPLIGRHNAFNLLGSLATLLASDIRFKDAIATLGKLRPVPGRMQKIGGGRLPAVVVDYAHSPDALEQVLLSLREAIAGSDARLVCVFGCGGDRDRGKRPLMGAVAARLADCVVITSDNPRTEDPLKIIADIRKGARGEQRVEPDRKRAISLAIGEARRGDIVLIAGKGHETYQEIEGVRRPFSDLAVARAALNRRQAA
ncbi:MAG: UDP-N-acetylmuramoyl-L-alanyl-D-glutamate--2,6-diaminopimelate ligase [Betaproteobacteria bacterium]|nr:UDP-N-acetylmuramoyl-L-alanyl-D-glutamate--2,6-diaminopimelate ligase [Betaproteobacteria bacterium]